MYFSNKGKMWNHPNLFWKE